MTSMHIGWYSIIQICPNAERLERANVGLVILSTKDGARIYTGESEFSEQLIRSSKLGKIGMALVIEGFVSRLRLRLESAATSETLEKFKPRGANPICLSDVREVIIRHIDVDGERLFKRLV